MTDKGIAVEYANALSNMIKLPTVFDPDGDRSVFDRFYDLLGTLFPNVMNKCRKLPFTDNIGYVLEGTDSKEPIILMSHHDVVDAGCGWSTDPYAGEIRNGRIWGRGTLDVKGNLFCILQAAEELLENGHTPGRTVYIISSCMEEVGGNDEAADWFISNNIRPVLLLDEGSPIVDDPTPEKNGRWALLSIAEKGYMDLDFIAKSSGGHSSAPTRNGPLVRLGAFMAECDSSSVFEPEMVEAAEMECETTIAFTMAHGSEHANIIPTRASVTANLRLSPQDPPEKCIEKMCRIAGKYDLSIEPHNAIPASPVTDSLGTAYQMVQNALNTVMPGVGVMPFILSGGTDCKHFYNVCDSCIRFTPLFVEKQQQEAVHGIDENIFIDSLPGAVDFFKALIQS